MFEVTVEQTFSAGHALRNYKGKCENVHGHNFKVQVVIEGERLDETGLLVDFIDVKQSMRSIIDRLDHVVPERCDAFRCEESVGGKHRGIFLLRNGEFFESRSSHSYPRSQGVGNRNSKRYFSGVTGF